MILSLAFPTMMILIPQVREANAKYTVVIIHGWVTFQQPTQYTITSNDLCFAENAAASAWST